MEWFPPDTTEPGRSNTGFFFGSSRSRDRRPKVGQIQGCPTDDSGRLSGADCRLSTAVLPV